MSMGSRAYNIIVALFASAYIGLSSYVLRTVDQKEPLIIFIPRLMIQLFFLFDFIYRLLKSKGKWQFLRGNALDFIATISLQPALSFFRIPRLLTAVGLMNRLKRTALYRGVEHLLSYPKRFVRTNGLVHIVYINVFAITIGSLAAFYFERGITFQSYGDALWWAIVTVTTVGYGDFVPKTLPGRAVAVLLMVFGIALISMLTGAIATYFNTSRTKMEEERDLKSFIDSLDEAEIRKLKEMLNEKTKGM